MGRDELTGGWVRFGPAMLSLVDPMRAMRAPSSDILARRGAGGRLLLARQDCQATWKDSRSVVYACFDGDGCLRPFGRSRSNAPNPVSSCYHGQGPNGRIILSLPHIDPS
jgi:hypothetical protein